MSRTLPRPSSGRLLMEVAKLGVATVGPRVAGKGGIIGERRRSVLWPSDALAAQLRKQHIREPEPAEVPHPHRIQRAVEVVAFVLHYAGVKALGDAVDRLSIGREALVADAGVAGYDAAQAGHREAAFPAVLGLVVQRRDHRVDEDGHRYRRRVRVTLAVLEAEDHHAQADADL